jgi:hypothetical protein
VPLTLQSLPGNESVKEVEKTIMSRETLERMARDLAAEIPLPAEDWQAAVDQAEKMLAIIKTLDELPLADVEPA